MNNTATFSLTSLLLFLLMLPVLLAAETGPSPYPTDKSSWPGKGAIRTFKWMFPTREAYFRAREKDQGAIVFTGDSLTQNWRTLSKDFPDMKVANRAIGGDTSRGILFRFKEDVLALNPVAVVILAGTNDLTARGKAADTLFNINEMIKQARDYKADIPIILCKIPLSSQNNAPVDDAVRIKINEGLQKIAANDNLIVVCPLDTALLDSAGKQDLSCYRSDRLHLGPDGYVKWKAAIMPLFIRLNLVPENK